MKHNVSLKLFLWELPTNTEYQNKVLAYISIEKYLIFFTRSHESQSALEISFGPKSALLKCTTQMYSVSARIRVKGVFKKGEACTP